MATVNFTIFGRFDTSNTGENYAVLFLRVHIVFPLEFILDSLRAKSVGLRRLARGILPGEFQVRLLAVACHYEREATILEGRAAISDRYSAGRCLRRDMSEGHRTQLMFGCDVSRDLSPENPSDFE